MARDLKPGDGVRTVDGIAHVGSITPEQVRPVFNLEVADDATFFAGAAGVLTHDNTPIGRRSTPFDAVASLDTTTP